MADSETRAQYLSLALHSRRLIDGLICYLDAGVTAPNLKDELESAVQSIGAMNSSQNVLALYSRLNNRSVFSHYEQLRVIDEVRESLGNPDITGTISRFISADTPEEKKNQGFEVLHFFSALESRALQDYNVQMQVPRR